MSYRKNLNKVKKALKQLNKDNEPENNSGQATTLRDIKKMYKSQNENLDAKKLDRKNLKKIARKRKSVTIKWNFNLGDLVAFTDRESKEHVGIIIKQHADGDFKSLNQAKWSGNVLVMSSAGRLWVNPKQLERID